MISPTPYASLCRGYVTHQNPLMEPCSDCRCVSEFRSSCPTIVSLCCEITRRVDHVLDPTTGVAFWIVTHQHGPACRIGPPYVYAVDVNSPIEEIFKVIDEAISTPIRP
jgi:hypothetical protein